MWLEKPEIQEEKDLDIAFLSFSHAVQLNNQYETELFPTAQWGNLYNAHIKVQHCIVNHNQQYSHSGKFLAHFSVRIRQVFTKQ